MKDIPSLKLSKILKKCPVIADIDCFTKRAPPITIPLNKSSS